jgi:hypothetical protein
MIHTIHEQNRGVQLPDYRRFGLCLSGDESKGLTKLQTKANPGNRAKS